ncbi:MAG: DegV family EDD domain-containing protein [Lachnospiraceae bacterium]|nr:DegV family EDD domain-containing protein [Lachnospiraceae bacterium]
MFFRKVLDTIADTKRDIQERLLLLISLIALVALFTVFVGGLFLGENAASEIVIGIGFLVFLLIIYFSVRYNRLRLGAAVSALVIIFAVLPLTFFTSGGVFGGSPVWIVLCAVIIAMTNQGRRKYILFALGGAVVLACYFLSYRFPGLLTQHSYEAGYQDSLMSVIVVSIMVCLMFEFSLRVYRAESRRSEEQRIEIDKLNQAQNQFFSSMSHEIRTPISSIIGLNEMILREDVSDEVREDALNIQSASRLLLHIINDILDMSKLESGKMEIERVPYQLEQMLSDIVGMIWIRAKEKGLEFHVDVDPTLPSELYGDEIKIKQVLINLLTNAVKYTNDGSVTLSVQAEKREEGKILVTYTVSDTGIGIRKENIPHLFDAFKRVDTERNRYVEGTGLGLLIVKQFTELMGGEVKVNSVYMQGSSFVVQIPQEIRSEVSIGNLDLENRHRQLDRNRYRQSFEAPSAKILVVDDNSVNLMVVKKLLRDTRAQIDTAESGEICLQKTVSAHYDLILMDHLMPQMDGIECLHRIRDQVGGRCKDTRVCVLTANAGSEKQAMYLREGFDGYLLKPVNGEQLEEEAIRLLPKELVHILRENGQTPLEEKVVRGRHARRIPILITTDSVCDLPKELVKKRGLAILPYHVNTPRGKFLDGIETESRELITYMKENIGDVRSQAPVLEEYEAFFAKQLQRASNIIHIAMASRVSTGFETATEAAGTFDNVTVVDSGHLSSSMGMMVLEAVRLAEAEKPVEEIVKELNELKERIHTSFIVEDTEYLTRTGHMNPVIGRLTQAFMLHPMPVLTLRKSRMGLGRICFGTKESAWKKYISSALSTTRPVDTKLLFITSAGLTQAELRQIEKEVRKIVTFEQVIFQKASSAISVNCGPGSFGLLFKTVS